MKKIITVLLVFILASQAISFAQTMEDSYAYFDDYTLVIGGISPFGEGHTVTTMVTFGSDMLYFNFQDTDEQGSFEFRFTLDPAVHSAGTYQVVMNGAGIEKIEKPVELMVKGEADAILGKIKGSNINDIAADLAGEAEKIGIKLNGAFAELNNQTSVYEMILKGNYNSLSQLKSMFDAAVAVQHFNESDETEGVELIQSYADALKLSSEVELFDNIKSNELKATVYQKVCGGNIELTAEDFKKIFADATYTALLNGLNKTDKEDLLIYAQECNDLKLAQFPLKDYEGLDDDQKAEFLSDMIAFIKEDAFEDLARAQEAFRSVLDSLTEEPEETLPSNPGFGGTIGGGGGTGGGGIKVTIQNDSAQNNVDGDAVLDERDDKLVSAAAQFTDLDDASWAKAEIAYLASKGIVNGKGNGVFDPNGSITRAEFVKMMVSALDVPNMPTENRFADVNENDWYYEPVMRAYAAGVINGVEYNRFGPEELITREQVCTIIYRTMLLLNAEITTESMEVAIADHDAISDYAVAAVESMLRANIVQGTGDGKFAPADCATRAQIAKIIYRVLERIGDL